MKIAGHTMGTPEYTLPEAIDFFAATGMDGIEIIVQQDGYRCALPLEAGEAELESLKRLLAERGLGVACLTPYLNLFNSLDEGTRELECERLRKVIRMAGFLSAPSIRIYGGKFVTGEADPDGRKLAQLAKSMRECGDYAKDFGVKLCMENHFGTMTTTAARSAEIAALIDHPNVGILYDQANIAFFPAEEYEEAIRLQKGRIYHVHVKDLVYRGAPAALTCTEVSHIKEDERTVHSRIPGEGILDWPAILKELAAAGYDGWLSLEYERRWQTIDLPHASIGMPQARNYITSILDAMGRATEGR